MAKKKYTNKSGDTFEWEETEEMRKAIHSQKEIKRTRRQTKL